MSRRLTFLITDLNRGGAPLLLAALAPGLAARAWDVDVVSIAGEGEIAGIMRTRGIPITSLAARGRSDLAVIPRFARHINNRRPAIVSSLLIHANLLATLARPFIAAQPTWVHSIHTLQDRPAWHWYLQGVLCSFADSLVAPSRAIIEKLNAFGPVPRPKVIPNGIEIHRFTDAPSIPPTDRPWPANSKIVGYVGRFDPVKRLPLLLDAAALLRHEHPQLFDRLHIALVGYGTQEESLRSQTARLNLTSHVHFLGASALPERWYKTFDLFCSPSPAEGFGLTLVEAAAAGLKVIACRTRAVEETLDDAFWISPNASPAELAAMIVQALAAKNWRPISPTAMETRYGLDTMVQHYDDYFTSMIR